jgi:predicted Zn-dependent protease
MRTASLFLVAALAATTLAGCAPSPEERLARGVEALKANRYSEARPDLMSVLQDDPANRVAQLALVRTHLGQENPTDAMDVLDRMAAKGPLSAQARLLRGEANLMLGRFDAASESVAADRSAEAWRIRAIAHVGRGETDQAAQAFAMGQRAPGQNARLLADFAHFRMGQGDVRGGQTLALKAMRAEPRNLHALMVCGDVAMATGRHADANKWYSRAARAYPESRSALFGRIVSLAELKRFGEVRKLVAAARVNAPNDTELLYFEAKLAADSKDWEKARDLLQPYETGLADMPLANTLYAEAMMRLGQVEQARTRLSSQLLREPDNRRVRLLLGEAKLTAMDPEGALEILAPIADLPDASAQERALLAKAEALVYGG